jgi:hypothetical protein
MFQIAPRIRSGARFWLAGALALCMLPAAGLGSASAQTYNSIQEDWEVHILQPDMASATDPLGVPQIQTELAVGGSGTSIGICQINCRDLPTTQLGGIQVQLWRNGSNLSYSSYGTGSLTNANQKANWTQFLTRSNGKVYFGMLSWAFLEWGWSSGSSITSSADSSTTATGMDNYDYNTSLANAAVNYGASRVKYLKLVRVRKYKVNGDVDTIDVNKYAFGGP